MKRYKLLKDLPTFKAGDLFYISEYGALVYDDGDGGVMAYARQTLDMFPNILTEWFKEIQEPTDSIHWEPLPGDIYWYLSNTGVALKKKWMSSPDDIMRYVIGNTYRTEKECKRAKKRRLAEVRLRRTSTFKPDLKNGNSGWIIGYDYSDGEFSIECLPFCDYGEIVRYETKEEAEKSIKENREDWLIYFGISLSDIDKS